MPEKINPTRYKTEKREGGYLLRSPREASLRMIDEEKRTAELSFSSETPVERWFGVEILGHGKDEMRTEWIASGRAPLLLDHDWREHIGVIESAELSKDGKGRAVVRFGKSAKAEEAFADVRDGIRSSVSVGYFINAMVLEETGDDVEDTYRVTDWEPFEISLVAVPADRDVGVGRSVTFGGRSHTPPLITVHTPLTRAKEDIMPESLNPSPTPSAAPKVEFDANKAMADLRKKESDRVSAIRAVASAHKLPDMADEAIADGCDLPTFQSRVLERLAKVNPKKIRTVKEDDALIGMSDKEVQQFSILRAINAIVMKNPELAPFEMEVARATQAKYPDRAFEGQFQIPFDVMVAKTRRMPSRRALSVAGSTAGAELVGTDHLGESFIDALRAKMLLTRMGARYLNGLVGDVSIPKLSGGATAYWVEEGVDVTESDQSTGAVLLTPKTVGARTKITRKLLKQSSPDAEMLVRDDLTKVCALAGDKAGFSGSGSSGEPTGIVNVSGIGAVDYGAGVIFDDVVDMETEVNTDDALEGTLHYVTTPALKGAMKKTDEGTDTGVRIWRNEEINGYPAHTTTQMVANEIIFGNYADLMIGGWGVMDIKVDDVTLIASGGIQIVVLQDLDIAVRHPESFCRAYT